MRAAKPTLAALSCIRTKTKKEILSLFLWLSLLAGGDSFLCYNEVMAIVTPQTDLILLQCPLEADQENQITFSNATAQYNYFYGLTKRIVSDSDFTYQRKDGMVRVPMGFDEAVTYNYCMYRNAAFSNKWFYAFIVDIQYYNDNVTMIRLETDVWQTWQFNLTFKPSFIVREHTNNDAVGANILDEGLNVGEYVNNGYSDFSFISNNQDYWVAVQVTDTIPKFVFPSNRVYNGIPQGCWTFLIDSSENFTTNFNNLIKRYDIAGKADAITAMYILPKSFCSKTQAVSQTIDESSTGAGDPVTIYYLPPSTTANTLGTYYWTRNTTINGYTPKNNKLFCYPYNYLMISNNDGNDTVYHWEDFSSSNANFTMRGVATQGCQIRITPSNYKNTDLTGGYAWSSTAKSLPILSWNSDYYLNWQAKNGVKSAYNATQSYATDYVAAGQAVAGGQEITPQNVLEGMGRTLASFGQIFSGVASEVSGGYSASITPDETRGVVMGDLSYSLGRNCFTGYKMSIKAQQARMIDDFFSMYGYRTDRVKTPNITGRRYWNFVKTNGCNVIGDVPQSDIEVIKAMFNSGITFWHDPTKYLDYSQTNTIV